MASNENFEEELQDVLQEAVNTYLEGEDAVDENDLADFIVEKAKDFALDWAANHPEEVLGKVFGEDTVKNSGIDVNSITTAYDAAGKINDAIELGIDLRSIIDGASAYYAAENDDAARIAALGQITSGFLSVTKIAVEQIPITGPMYSLIVGELQNCFESGFNLVTAHVAQLQYTELMCDYYAGNMDIAELYRKISEIYNLPEKDKEQIDALLAMESKLDSEGVSQSCISQSKKDQWINKGHEIYNSMAQDERDEYGKDWTYDSTEKTKQNSGTGYGNAGNTPPPKDPLIIDLGEKGIKLTTLDLGVHFDLDKNGFAEKTAWTSGDDGFLALDRNGNDSIDDGGELFGDQVTLKDGTTSASGFEALAELDDNRDGIIDANDSQFDALRVWVDANKDGKTDPDELKKLSDLKITSISLDHFNKGEVDEVSGTTISESSTVTYDDGTTSEISEHWFKVNSGDTEELYDFGDGTVITGVDSFGNVMSLNNAIHADDTGALFDLVEQFKGSNDYIEKRILVKRILYFITNSNEIEFDSRGGNIDARDLHVVEQFMGRAFTGIGGTSPNTNAAVILKNIYSDLENMYFNLLNKETAVGEYLELIVKRWNQDGKYLDISLFESTLAQMRQSGENVDNVIAGVASWLHQYDKSFDDTLFTSLKESLNEYSDIFDNIVNLNVLIGGDNADTLNGSNNFDVICADAGDDTIKAGYGNDLVYGGNGNDTIYGEAGDDAIYGDNGDDILHGGAGNDTIYGGAGNDAVYGDAGDDILIGGDGDDTYIFNENHGNDVVRDTDGNNTLVFGDGLSADDYDVSLTIDGNFILTHKETGETISLPDLIMNPLMYDFSFDGEGKVLGGGGERTVSDGTAEDDVITAEDGFNIIYGNGGNDTITGGENIDFIFGGDGNDTIDGGNGMNILHGEAGDDVITDGDGDSYLNGGDGNDTLFAGAGNDILIGGDGDDEMHGEEGDDVLAGGDGDDILDGGDGDDTLYGDAGDDTLHGGNGNDSLFGGDGNDILYGGNGDDYLESGNGNNTMYGGDGNDTFVTGEGTNYVYGEAGDDYIIGGNGDNYMYGGDGGDRLQGGDGYDYMEGGAGNDELSGGNGNNEMFGQDGDDRIYGGNDNDYIDGGMGKDSLYGGNGENEIYGRDGDDIIYDGDDGSYIYGGNGNDSIYAGGGNDVIDGGFGDDYIQGDHGDDTVIFGVGYGTDTISDAAGNNTLVLSDLSIEDAVMSKINGNDLKISFGEDNVIIKQYFDGAGFQNFNIDGTSLNDLITTLHGTESDDWMSAWSSNGSVICADGGNDNINGGNGNDVLDGGAGNDSMYGYGGDDTYIFAKGYGNDTIEDWSGSSLVRFTDINIDELTVSSVNDSALVFTVAGTGDTLTVNGYKWNQDGYTFEFADGTTDTINRDTWKWASGYENAGGEITEPEGYTLNGTDNGEWLCAPNNNGGTIFAGGGNDGLNGGSGADILYGGDGDDSFYGNDGDDILDGGSGTDSLCGGNGMDTYIFAKGYGVDTVNEWGNDSSIIRLTDINSDEVTASDQWGSNLVLSVNGTEDSLIVSNFKWGQASFTFEFADGAIATVNKDTWALEFCQLPAPPAQGRPETLICSNAELLCGLYEDGRISSDMLGSDNSDVILGNAAPVNEASCVSDRTDLQVMLLTENMSAFGAESNISTITNITDITDTSVMNQLLVGTQVQ